MEAREGGYHLNVDKLIGEHLVSSFGTVVAGCGNLWPWRQDGRCRPKGKSWATVLQARAFLVSLSTKVGASSFSLLVASAGAGSVAMPSGHGILCPLKTVSPKEPWARTNSPPLCGFLAHLVATVRKVTNKHPHLRRTLSKLLHGFLNPRTLLSPVHVLCSDHRYRGWTFTCSVEEVALWFILGVFLLTTPLL